MKPSDFLKTALSKNALKLEQLKAKRLEFQETTHSLQLGDLIKENQEKMEHLIRIATLGEKTVKKWDEPQERQMFYRSRPALGAWDCFCMIRLIRQYRDAPPNHPYMRGYIDFKKGIVVAPFEDTSWDYFMWMAGWHERRRNEGNRIDGDAA